MKAKKTAIALINSAIFAGTVAIGTLSGTLTGNYPTGVYFGICLGIMGIIFYGYLREAGTSELKAMRIHIHDKYFKRHSHGEK